MASPCFDIRLRPRELRRRVVLPARVRAGACWSDACILNLSSRGLMIQASKASTMDGLIELHRGPLVIVARVVWRDGLRLGLEVEEALPVCEILAVGQDQGAQLTSADSLLVDRRKKPRGHEASRLQGRAIEFAGIAVIAAAMCLSGLQMVKQAFARPLAQVQAALSN